jgi:hypothetical protein
MTAIPSSDMLALMGTQNDSRPSRRVEPERGTMSISGMDKSIETAFRAIYDEPSDVRRVIGLLFKVFTSPRMTKQGRDYALVRGKEIEQMIRAGEKVPDDLPEEVLKTLLTHLKKPR